MLKLFDQVMGETVIAFFIRMIQPLPCNLKRDFVPSRQSQYPNPAFLELRIGLLIQKAKDHQSIEIDFDVFIRHKRLLFFSEVQNSLYPPVTTKEAQ